MRCEKKPLQAHIIDNDNIKKINNLQREVADSIRDIDERISYNKLNNIKVKVTALKNERKKLVSLSNELYNKQLRELLRIVTDNKTAGIGEYTLAEVGEALGITRERVRQLESMALKKMKSPRFARNFSRYVDMRLNPAL